MSQSKRCVFSIWMVALATVCLTCTASAQQDTVYHPDAPFMVVESLHPEATEASESFQRFGLTRDDYERIVQIPIVEKCIPFRNLILESAAAGRNHKGLVSGVTSELAEARGIEIERGRFLTAADMKTNGNVVVISATVQSALFPFEDPIGRNVMLGNKFFKVVGVFEDSVDNADEDDQSREGEDGDLSSESRIHQLTERVAFYIPINSMRARYGDQVVAAEDGRFTAVEYELSGVWIQLDRGNDVEESKALVKRTLLETQDGRKDLAFR